MPERYEREVDAILRNMEGTRPKPSLRERLGLGRGPTRRAERLRPRLSRATRRLLRAASLHAVRTADPVGAATGGAFRLRGGSPSRADRGVCSPVRSTSGDRRHPCPRGALHGVAPVAVHRGATHPLAARRDRDRRSTCVGSRIGWRASLRIQPTCRILLVS